MPKKEKPSIEAINQCSDLFRNTWQGRVTGRKNDRVIVTDKRGDRFRVTMTVTPL